MRLKSLFVSDYKNLKNFTLSFDGTSFIDVFVGKNGSGKSNLFEVLTEIFHHLFGYDKEKGSLDFDYTINYEIDGTITEIAWNAGALTIDGKPRATIGKTPLPDNVLIYYSGHNDTVAKLVQRYEGAFRKHIKGANFDESRRFIGVGPEYKALLLSVLLTQPDDNKARQFVCQKLGIEHIGSDLQLVLQRPSFATGALKILGADNIENFDPRTHYWGADGITRDFLEKLVACVKGEFNHADVFDADKDRYQIPVNIELFQERFAGESIAGIFRQFDNLKTLGMLADISIPITLTSGLNASIAYFSDGQFQSVYIYSIVELFKDRNCLILLDEPDAFLHPEWQFDFLRQVFDITDNVAKTCHILMSSHSAVTLISHEKKQVSLFDIHDSKVVCRVTSKDYAISKLSSSLIKYKEDEQILSILRNIRVEGMPVLFTEGSTDPDILKEAWRKLYDQPIPFIPIYAFCCDYLRRVLQDNRIINEMGGRPVFGLFDFDEAYNEWNYLNQKDNWALRCDDPYLGLRTENAADNVHAFILPVPRIAKIEGQVMRTPGSKNHFAHQSKMDIEHLFYGVKTAQYFEAKKLPGDGEIITFSGNKTRFARDVVPSLDTAAFEVLRPLFEFIKSKCAGGAPA